MIKCDVIRDLLPLYIDDVASESSRAEVEAHIKTCSDCREILARMRSGGEPIRLSVDKAEIGAFKIMKRKIRRKNFIIACVSIVVTAALIYGAFGYCTPLLYDKDKINVNLAYDEVIDIHYDGNYMGATARQADDAVYIGYAGSLWTRLYYNGEKKQFSIGNNIMVDYGGNGEAVKLTIPAAENPNMNVTDSGDSVMIDIDGNKTVTVERESGNFVVEQVQINRIYYMDYRKINLNGDAFEKAKKDAILIWER